MAGEFSLPEWAASTNIYEVNVRQYTVEGTLKAFAKHLPRLKKMGVETLWFMPLTPISNEERQGTLGSYYACNDFTSINPEFGTEDDFKMIVRDAHELGMKVLVDIVANHTGYDHVWKKRFPKYYKTNKAGEFYDSHGWVDVIDLNYENKDLRRAMIEVMKYWVETYDVDGFRCDMAHLVPIDFWREARTELDKQKQLFWLAETEDAAYHEVFDCSFTWRALHLGEEMYKGHKSVNDLLALIEDYAKEYPETALRLYFTSNHDENSHSGSEFERLGNAAKAISVFSSTTSNSIPLLYSGQELPNRRRLLFFDKDAIEWTGQYMMEDFYSTLLHVRKRNTALWAGDPANEMVLVETSDRDHHILAFVRTNHQDAVLVILNLSNTSMLKFTLTDLVETGLYRSIWSGLTFEIDNDVSFEMQAWEYLVFEKVG